jgi:TonB-linked SusC/RagA family outer membrane protein
MNKILYKALCVAVGLCCVALPGYASGEALQPPQVYDLNLSYQKTNLKTVADAITGQIGVVFSYEIALGDYAMENVNVKKQGADLEDILSAVFTPSGINYHVVNKVVVLTRGTKPVEAPQPQQQQQKTEIKGTVKDGSGNPMIGVTVNVKGTMTTVITGIDGGYTIMADKASTLSFSYVGYRAHEEPVGQRGRIDVTMDEDQLVMDEVVVVGYGTLKKRNIVGAVESISGEALEDRSNANITRSLQGQVPGLNIVQVDGKSTHQGQVTIRGVNNSFKARVTDGQKANTLGQGGGALVLIDGAEGDMGSVNPADIASITVLKDASSAAVYGARGAFGVILITTKNPEKGKVLVNYSGSVSVHRRTVIWEDEVVTDPVQWVDGFRESYLNSSPTSTVPSMFNNYMPYSNAWFDELKSRNADPTMDNYAIDSNGDYQYYGNTNWLKELLRPANYSTTHSLSVQGGREGVSFYVSGRYYSQDGIYKVGEEKYNKYNLRAKGSVRIRKWLTLDNNTSMLNSFYHQPMVHYGQNVITRQLDTFAYPFALLKNPDGTWTQTAAKTGFAAFAEGTSWQENKDLDISNTTTLNFTIIPEVFKVTADFTYKGARSTRDRMTNLYTYYTGVNVSGQDNSYSDLENWNYITNYISTNIVGTYTPKLKEKHDLNVVAGWNLEDYDHRAQKTYRQGNLYPTTPSFTLMDGEYYTATSGGYTWGLVGFFGRVNYAYDNRYLIEVSARYDGSSKFPKNSQWGFFPSASLGWCISEEPWFKPLVAGWMDNMKIRGSIGSLGNANIDPYQYLETMIATGSQSIAKSSVIINSQNVAYTSVPSLIPDDITWEKVTTYNIGLDLEFLRSRLTFTGDYYRRNTSDLYTVGPNLPQVLGSEAPKGNYASLKTKGWELSLGWRDSFMAGEKQFTYSVKAMLWDSRSWITDYYNETGDLTTYYKGMEIGEIWGFRTAGIYASNAEALEGPAYNFFKNGEMFRAYAGDLRFVDVNGDGIMTKGSRTLSDHGDMEIIGNASPRYQYSINVSANWNGIGLSMLWQGVGKRDWYPWTETGYFWGKWNRAYNSTMKTQTGDNVVNVDKSTDNWVVTNMDKNPYWTRMVSLAANRNDGPLTWENDHYLQKVSYVRLKNITLDYSFPKRICSKIGIEGLRVYVSGENLFTASPLFKRTKMFDPEVITSGDSDFAASEKSGLNSTGQGYSYPMLKSVTLGLNLTF